MAQQLQVVDCRWCRDRHTARFLCDPAKRILDALYAKGMEGNMPTIVFPEPVPMSELGRSMGLQPEDRLIRQFVCKAATASAAGVPNPVLIFTGRDGDGNVLPQWVYPAEDETIARTGQLVADMSRLAIQQAVERRRRARG